MNAESPTGAPSDSDPSPQAGLRARVVAALLVLLAVGLGAWLRIDTAFDSAAFRETDPKGLLRSDPGFLYYVTRSVAEADGLLPADLRADVHVEWPAASDLPAMFSLGQELFVGWAWRLFGGGVPLHRFATVLMAVFASLSVVGVFGLARELTGKLGWAAAAAALYLVLPGNYRTIGFVLIREDFALPFLALHLWLLARAWRVRTPAAGALAGLTLVAAAATWHAMGFFLTIEAGVLLAWFLRTGRNPLAARGAGAFLLVVAAGSLAVPVLFSKGFLVSLPVLIALSLWTAARLEGRLGDGAWKPRAAAVAALLALALLGGLVGPLVFPGAGDYAHVFELLSAKLAHAGRLPEDPAELSFDARLLWQGPFATPTLEYVEVALGVGLLAALAGVLVGAAGWLRARGDSRTLVLFAVAGGGLVAMLLVQRTIVLPALLSPVVAVCLLARVPNRALQQAALWGALLFQAWTFQAWIGGFVNAWYTNPAAPGEVETMMTELGQAVRWIEANVPADEAISSDFVTGTAVLAHAGNPMLVQPKYETEASRRRIQTFMEAFLKGNLRDYRALLLANDCRYVLVNRHYWINSLYVAGIRADATWRPDPRTPLARLCSPDPAIYSNLRGFELVYRQESQFGADFMRVYRVLDER